MVTIEAISETSEQQPPPPTPPPLPPQIKLIQSQEPTHSKKNQQQQQKQRHITLDLIRKRSEHNECLVSTLEEIALHQEELESIGPILGKICGKTLRILLLQNNVIDRMNPSDLRPFRSLEYLNVALNNIAVVEGIAHLEFLKKVDLTLNFIGFMKLEESVDCMRELRSLKELFMVGNPCAFEKLSSERQYDDNAVNTSRDDNDDDENCSNAYSSNNDTITMIAPQNKNGWNGFRKYIIAKLPLLESLDGRPILRSERIMATQHLPQLELQLRQLVDVERLNVETQRRQKQEYPTNNNNDGSSDDNYVTQHCPEDRVRISNEMAEQKLEKKQREMANQPKRRGVEEFELEQEEAIERARQREEKGQILQCNEGKWKYVLSEENKPGHIQLDISIQKHLSSSLIDVDVHPTLISVVIKSKVLRLLLPAEVISEQSVAQRSITTGHLLITVPKCNPEENVLLLSKITSTSSQQRRRNEIDVKAADRRTRRSGLNQDIIQAASSSSSKQLKGSVRISNLIVGMHNTDDDQPKKSIVNRLDMTELCTTVHKKIGDGRSPPPRDDTVVVCSSSESCSDCDEPPPPF